MQMLLCRMPIPVMEIPSALQTDMTDLDQILAENFDIFNAAEMSKRFYDKMKARSLAQEDARKSRWSVALKKRDCDKSPKKAR